MSLPWIPHNSCGYWSATRSRRTNLQRCLTLMMRRDDEIEHLQTPAGLAPIGAGVLADAAVHSLPVLGPLLSLVRPSMP